MGKICKQGKLRNEKLKENKNLLRIALRVIAIDRSLESLKRFLKLKQRDYAIDELYTIMSAAECAVNLALKMEKDELKQKLSETRKLYGLDARLPKVVCLVGSTKPQWKKRYRQVEEELTQSGFVVFSVVWFRGELENFEKHRPLLETIHFQKIRRSDAVVLIHSDAKGHHTSMELEFASKIGKPIVTFTTVNETTEKLLEALE